MSRLPTVITTSVVRSAHQGESHGGVYLVDLETATFDKVIDWNTCDIDWQGRGGDRGLRGIAFHNGKIFIAASDEILIYDTGFSRNGAIRNRYLRHCHEIFIYRDRLYLSSTGFDAVLEYDLQQKRFANGYFASLSGDNIFSVNAFDPESDAGPARGDMLHLNSVYADTDGLHIAGLGLPFIILIDATGAWQYGRLPPGTHNARPLHGNIIFNNTAANCISITRRDGTPVQSFPVPVYGTRELVNSGLPEDHARQGFARGLCVIEDGEYLVAGSSPSTISVYSVNCGAPPRRINLSMDVRNAIHGLEVWPFS